MMAIKNATRTGLVAALATILAGCLGGQGSTDGGSGAEGDFRDNVFVSDETTTGGMTLEVESSSIDVGDTSSFVVHVRNARQEPVSNVNVICDTEGGLALIEPSSGYALTNGDGAMSGVVGCEAPGSLQLVCRLSIGANRRQFASVRCTGDVPSGFQGFPGAGGGGLGGGVQTNDDGDVRITQASFIDESGGSSSSSTTSSIDIVQNSDCNGDGVRTDFEPFYDTYIEIKVQNNRSETVRFSYLQYTISNVDGQGTEFTSKRLGLSTESEAGAASGGGGTTSITMPIFKAFGGGKFVGDPLGVGLQIVNPALLTTKFVLVGETSSGEPVELSARATASFGSFNRCPSS
jgi:hypothetical protein